MSSLFPRKRGSLFPSAGWAFSRAWSYAAFMGAGAVATQAQITITSADMFNQVGQYYRAYANNTTNTVAVSSMLGTTGGPQAWDFRTGPQDVTYRFDYTAANQGMSGA